jgi:hypothetical protein
LFEQSHIIEQRGENVVRFFFFILTLAMTINAYALSDHHQKGAQRSETIQQARSQMVPNEIIVKFSAPMLSKSTASASIPGIESWLKTETITSMKQVFGTYRFKHSIPGIYSLYSLRYAGDGNPEVIAQKLSSMPGVEFASPRYIHRLAETPNDSLFTQQGYLQTIHIPEAWDIQKGQDGSRVIAVVDGGTQWNHPDLADNIWENTQEVPGNDIDDDGNGFIDDVLGWNFANSTPDPSPLPEQPQNGRHGTHVAGLVSAVTNNRTGISGTSWNAQIMPINAASPTSDNSILYGFEGILYAADNGADIINCSWGSLSSRSDYEQYVVDQVHAMGAVVVAAAGNDNSVEPHYPSAYRYVLSVAATDNSDQRASFSNYGSTVDVTAPGVYILSTITNDTYGNISGSSMSSPITAGVLALVGSQHPEWSGQQVAQQVRVTADNIDAVNPDFKNQLGRGRVNALRAVTSSPPAIRMTSVEVTDQNNDRIIDPGDNISLNVTVINYLESASDIQIELSEQNANILLSRNSLTIPTLGTLESVTLDDAFQFSVASNAPKGSTVSFALEVSSEGYRDRQEFTLTISPRYYASEINNIRTAFTPIGRIGYADTDAQNEGLGFHYLNSSNLLFEGALIMGTAPDRISNAARGIMNPDLVFDQDFRPTLDGDLVVNRPGALADEETIARFTDSATDMPLEIEILQQTFANANEPYQDFILMAFELTNTQNTDLTNLYFGLFADWDINGATYNTNVAEYDQDRQMGYVYDSSANGPDVYVGTRLLNLPDVNYRAIYNDEVSPSNPSWGIYDGFTDQEKWEAISSGTTQVSAGPADISSCLAAGPLAIAAQSSVTVGFALVGGTDLAQLQENADTAQTWWDDVIGSESGTQPDRMRLYPIYPNPFNRVAQIRYDIPESATVNVSVYNTLGEKVKTLIDRTQRARSYTISWDGRLASGEQASSGVYFIRLDSNGHNQTRKIVLVR